MSTSTQINTDVVARYVELTQRRKALEAEADDVKKQLIAIESELLDAFAETGVSSIRAGGGTISLRRELWAGCKDGDYERACRALRAAGLDEFVQPRFNASQLSAYVRELDREGAPLPSSFAGAINVSEVFKLRVTK